MLEIKLTEEKGLKFSSKRMKETSRKARTKTRRYQGIFDRSRVIFGDLDREGGRRMSLRERLNP